MIQVARRLRSRLSVEAWGRQNVLCPEAATDPRANAEESGENRLADGREPADDGESRYGAGYAGAWGANQATGIGQRQHARLKGRMQRKSEVRRKRWIKRVVYAVLFVAVVTPGVYYLLKHKRIADNEVKMEDAVKEFKGKDGKERVNGPMFALMQRASGEYRIKAATGDVDRKEAMMELKLARNTVKPQMSVASLEQNAILAEVAVTMVELLGTTEQIERGVRFKKDEGVVKEIRETIQAISDPDIMADAMRAITRKLAEKDHAIVANEIVQNAKNELRGQVGLELLRIDKDNRYRPEVEKLTASIQGGSDGKSPSIQTLRLTSPSRGMTLSRPLLPRSATRKRRAGRRHRGSEIGRHGGEKPTIGSRPHRGCLRIREQFWRVSQPGGTGALRRRSFHACVSLGRCSHLPAAGQGRSV